MKLGSGLKVLWLALGWCVGLGAGAIPTAHASAEPVLVCVADPVAVYPREKANLKAWARLPDGRTPVYAWSADAGTLASTDDEATWNLSGAKIGRHQARVSVKNAGRRLECTATVLLSLPPLSLMGEDRETGRALLGPGAKEAAGYGLYSYLVLGAEPDAASLPRYRSTLLEYLRFPEVSLLEGNGYKKAQLNITYLPLSAELSPEMLGDLRERRYDKYAAIVEWLLSHYDYARARALLKAANVPGRTGPYLVSSLQPLGAAGTASPRLLQDLSTVPPEVVKLWTRRFIAQTAQERFWDEPKLEVLALEARTFVALAAGGLPVVVESLSSLIKLLK